MKKFGIFYGSSTGTTADIAEKIAKILGVGSADIHNVNATSPSAVGNYETLILGSSTWGSGDLQDDWYDFLDGLKAVSLPEQKIAIFGLGDETMSDTFCNAVGKIYDAAKETGAKIVGAYDTEGYTFDHSDAVRDGQAVGLLLDEVNHPELTDRRLRGWLNTIAE
ncbi:MAG: flavodoxin [Muribaculaceae bacterium]|nr:flavodoxin [Muribaculaceae bacterium]